MFRGEKKQIQTNSIEKNKFRIISIQKDPAKFGIGWFEKHCLCTELYYILDKMTAMTN